MLEIKDLLVRRGSFTLEVPHLVVPTGECLGVYGKSGSGKSTLLEAVAGFLPLERGEIIANGRVLNDVAPEARGVALIFQKSFLFPHLSVLENVAFSYRVKGVAKPEREEKAKVWLEKLQLMSLAERKAHEISGGQAQRVALARALATGFPVLCLDEPFSALDSELRAEMRALVAHLVKQSGLSAILVSHDPDDFLGRALEVTNGKLVQKH